MTKITKKEMCAIASRYFSVALEEKNKKGLLVAALQAQIDARPGVLRRVSSTPLPLRLLRWLRPQQRPRLQPTATLRARTEERARLCCSLNCGLHFRKWVWELRCSIVFGCAPRLVVGRVDGLLPAGPGHATALLAIAKLRPSVLCWRVLTRGAWGLSMAAPELYFRP